MVVLIDDLDVHLWLDHVDGPLTFTFYGMLIHYHQ